MLSSLPKDHTHPVYTAHHEAGHVVAYLLHQQPFEYVTIRPNPPDPAHLGTVVREDALMPVLSIGVIRAAGPAGEALLRHAHESGGLDNQVPPVTALYERLATATSNGHPELHDALAYNRSALDEAAYAIASNWATVEAIATALLADETLTYDECVALATDTGFFDRSEDD